MSEWLPDYLEKIPSLKMLDPLGAFLTGNLTPQPVEYSVKDVFKQSGHSCPTIAGAFGITMRALESLYPSGQTPVRGDIMVLCPGNPNEGSMGPLTQAISYLTGACEENGFHGLAGKFVRKGLLKFSGEQKTGDSFVFTRLDNGHKVGIIYHSSKIPGSPAMSPLLQKCLGNIATDSEKQEFGKLWQQRVRFILEKEENRKQLFEVIEL